MSNYVDFAAVKTAVNIEAVIHWLGLDRTLKKHGDQWRGPCVLHGKTGERSMVITVSKGLFNNFCPQCKRGGDVIALVAHIKGISVRDAALEISKHFGLHQEPKAAEPAQKPPQPRTEALQPLSYLEPSHEFVQALGLTEETCKAFQTGYAGKGIMRGRLAIPVHDQQGKLLAYCGRAVRDDQMPALTWPKDFEYENVLFNAHRIASGDFVYVVRDPLQVLLATQNGIDNAICFLGEISSDALQVLALWMDERGISSVDLL